MEKLIPDAYGVKSCESQKRLGSPAASLAFKSSHPGGQYGVLYLLSMWHAGARL